MGGSGEKTQMNRTNAIESYKRHFPIWLKLALTGSASWIRTSDRPINSRMPVGRLLAIPSVSCTSKAVRFLAGFGLVMCLYYIVSVFLNRTGEA